MTRNLRALLRRRSWLAGAAGLLAPGLRRAGAATAPRILHVMSFDSPWRWTDGQFAGFKAALALPQAQYRVVQMDVKRNSTPRAKEQAAQRAHVEIENWQPQLVYVTDDEAQTHVTRRHAGSALPFVFSGMNQTPADHGLEGARNVTGVLEQEHFVETVRLARTLVPGIRRLAVISDTAAQWQPVIARTRERARELPDLALVAVDRVATFAAFQARMLAYPQRADAVLYLGIHGLAASAGHNVPGDVVQRWLVEHSRLPDLSFWAGRVHNGTLASVAVSEHEQGRAAGALARAILVGGAEPGALPVRVVRLGRPAINLARARQLGITVRSTQLLQSEIVQRFEWEGGP